MRFEQEHGINQWAKWLIDKLPATVYDVQDGAFTPQLLHLRRFKIPFGPMVEEFVQAEPWSGGPCYFLALRLTETSQPIAESLWSDDEISRLTRSGRNL
jgi:hypothetical protein